MGAFHFFPNFLGAKYSSEFLNRYSNIFILKGIKKTLIFRRVHIKKPLDFSMGIKKTLHFSKGIKKPLERV